MQQSRNEQELRGLIGVISASWPPEERAAAMAAALANPVEALDCYRFLAEQVQAAPKSGLHPSELVSARDPNDDRRTCLDCKNLTAKGQCFAAWRGERPLNVAVKHYQPITDCLGRCECYAPGPNDPDRRSGVERWPYMVESKAKLQRKAREGQ